MLTTLQAWKTGLWFECCPLIFYLLPPLSGSTPFSLIFMCFQTPLPGPNKTLEHIVENYCLLQFHTPYTPNLTCPYFIAIATYSFPCLQWSIPRPPVNPFLFRTRVQTLSTWSVETFPLNLTVIFLWLPHLNCPHWNKSGVLMLDEEDCSDIWEFPFTHLVFTRDK